MSPNATKDGRKSPPPGGVIPGRRAGRPTRFSPAVGADLISLYESERLTLAEAARRVGIGVRTLHDWLRRGRAEVEGADPAIVAWSGRLRAAIDRRRQESWDRARARDRAAGQARWRRFRAA